MQKTFLGAFELAGSIELRTFVPPVLPVLLYRLYVIDVVQVVQHIAAVENDLALKEVLVIKDMLMLNQNHHHVDIIEELVEVGVLVLGDLVVLKERVVTLERSCKVTFLRLKHLEGRGLSEVIYIFLVGEAVETHPAVVGDAVLPHDLVDSVEDECRLAVVGLHGLVYDLCKLRVVAHEEPRVNGDAVAAHTGARLKNIHTRVHVADPDDLVHVHVVVTADA